MRSCSIAEWAISTEDSLSSHNDDHRWPHPFCGPPMVEQKVPGIGTLVG